MKPIFYILILLMLITPVSAVTYPKEYYDLGTANDVLLTKLLEIHFDRWDITDWGPNIATFSSLITSRELRRQTILMEKQNELLEEQNGLLRNMTRTHCKPLWDGKTVGTTAIVEYDCDPVQP